MRTIVLFFIVMISGVSCSENPVHHEFISVQGKQFFRDGKPYYFLGTNVWYGASLGSKSNGGDRKRLMRELDHLKALGIDNLRILGASEGNTQHNTVNPAIQPELGSYDESVLEGLDFLLAEMAKREMVGVIYLNNFWVWSGGMSQYMAWINKCEVPNPFLEKYSWNDFMNFSATFYTSPEMNDAYRVYMNKLINRTNTITGKKYKDDPTIMSWQLANEPRPGNGVQGKENFPVFIKWVGETADYIKSIDPNHLVSTGNEGLAGSMESEELYQQIHQFNSIDYMTVHLWILNWRWFDPLKAEQTFPEATEKATQYLNKHIQYAETLNKPLVLEEFGIPRDLHSYDPAASTRYRDIYFNKIFDVIYKDAKTGGSFAGSNFWAWSGNGRPANLPESAWKVGDDFTGDPPQEPQGRNSVFSSDISTLSILKDYAGKMNGLNK